MKSRDRQIKINEFWAWFRNNANALSKEPESPKLVEELDERVHDVAPELSWEIGPGRVKPLQFVLSPNLDREFRDLARSIIAQAPEVDQWEFYPARQPKEWNYVLELVRDDNNQRVRIDASNWTFVLLEYPEGDREILLKGSNLPALEDSERWQAGAMALESLLGEDLLLDTVDEFELVDRLEPRFAERERPIHLLRAAVLGPTPRIN